MRINWEDYADKRKLSGRLEGFYYEDLLEKKSILDAACGDGAMLEPLQNLNGNHRRIIGMDISFKRLLRCYDRKCSFPLLQASITDLPFSSNSFDGIAAIYVLEHLTKSQTESMLSELKRVMTDDGCLVVAVPNKWSYRISYAIGHLFKKTSPPSSTHINMMTFKQYKKLLEKDFVIKKAKIVGLPYISILSRLGLGDTVRKIWKHWAVGFCFVLEKN